MRILLILLLILIAASTYSAEKLDIDDIEDESYLPLTFRKIRNYEIPIDREPIINSIFVLRSTYGDTGEAQILSGANAKEPFRMPARFSQRTFPDGHIIDDDNIYLTIKSCEDYYDTKFQSIAIFGIGYRRDSAYAFRYHPEEDNFDMLFLGTGKDITGDGAWIPHLRICGNVDYDYDGKTEFFLYVSSERDTGTRHLFCVEAETLLIEWSLALAGGVQRVYSCNDSLNPSVIFLKTNPLQGHSDENFSDFYKALVIINNKGEVLFNKVTSVRPSGSELSPGESEGIFYFVHETPFLEKDGVDSLAKTDRLGELYFDRLTLSKIDRKGNLIISKKIEGNTIGMWFLPESKDKRSTLFIMESANNRITSYDTDFNLLAVSGKTNIGSYLGKIELKDFGQGYVYGDGIYTRNFKKIMSFPKKISRYQTLVYHRDTTSKVLVVESGRSRLIGEIQEKTTAELITVFYHNNQSLVLMVVTALIVGLILINYYRRKSSRNLNLIRTQKKELEETHRTLKAAQRKLIDQEKYRQARDIAGGFAHEIRNTLFPAQSALDRLDKSGNNDRIKMDRLCGISTRSVNRAIALTRQISNYTKLESTEKIERVDLYEIIEQIFNDNAPQLDDNNIKTDIKKTDNAIIDGNRDRLYILFNNLLLNSIKAVRACKAPSISISIENSNGTLKIHFSDNGCGIAPEHISNVFNVFFTTDPDGGTGLGLSTVRKIVELHHGEIAVESTIDKSTTIFINLPTILPG